MARNTIGNLVVSLTANTSKFVNGMQRATKTLTRMGERVGRVTKRVAAFGAAMGAAAVAGLSLMVKRQLATIDTLAKLSDRIGIATRDLQGLQFAANLTGVETETLNRALEAYSRRVGEAAIGSGQAGDALEQLGLNAKDLVDLPLREQLGQIADRMAKLDNQTQRTSVAADLFSRAGISLVNTLQNGSAALDQMTGEAAALGQNLTRVDAAKVELANDAMSRVSGAIAGIAQRLTVELAPFIKATADRLVAWAKTGQGSGNLVSKAVGWVTTSIAKLADWLELVKAAFRAFQGVGLGALGLLIKGIDAATRGLAALANKLPGVSIEISNFMRDWSDVLIDDAAAAFDKAGENISRFWSGENFRAAQDAFANIRAEADAAAEAVAKQVEDQRKMAAIQMPALQAVSERGPSIFDKLTGAVSKAVDVAGQFVRDAVQQLDTAGTSFEQDRFDPGGPKALVRGTSAAASAIAAARRSGPEAETAKATTSMDKKLTGLNDRVERLAQQLAEQNRPLLVTF